MVVGKKAKDSSYTPMNNIILCQDFRWRRLLFGAHRAILQHSFTYRHYAARLQGKGNGENFRSQYLLMMLSIYAVQLCHQISRRVVGQSGIAATDCCHRSSIPIKENTYLNTVEWLLQSILSIIIKDPENYETFTAWTTQAYFHARVFELYKTEVTSNCSLNGFFHD